jgi:plastocyanin
MIEDKPRTDLPRPQEDRQPEGPRLPPIAYPLLGLVFGAVLVWSFSRILLASPDITIDLALFTIHLEGQYVAVAVATLTALNILVGSALIAYGRRVRRRPASFPLVVAGGLIVVAAGIVAFTFGDQPPGEGPGGEPGAPPVALTASGIAFQQQQLTLPGGGEVIVEFQNQDEGVPHDFVLFDGADATARQLFDGPEIIGVSSTEYRFPAPPPGTYFFHCSIHPTQMTGTATVMEGGGPGPGPGPGPSALEVTARGTAFTPTELSVPPGPQVRIHFVNEDDAIPHNISIFEGEDDTGTQVLAGEIITGPAEIDYSFAAEPGSYFFRCDIHPTQMTGTITVG